MSKVAPEGLNPDDLIPGHTLQSCRSCQFPGQDEGAGAASGGHITCRQPQRAIIPRKEYQE